MALALACATALIAASAAAPPPKMVPIPAGTFLMGYSQTPLPASLLNSPPKDGKPAKPMIFPDGDADESPAHRVSVHGLLF